MYKKRMRNRIERTRRLIEATTVIGQTLRDAFEPTPGSKTAAQPSEPFVEGTFRVVDPEPAPGPEWQDVELTVITRPASNRTERTVKGKQTTSQPVPENPSTETPHRQETEVTIIAPPTPGKAGDSPKRKQTAPPSPAPTANPKSSESPDGGAEAASILSNLPLPLGLPQRLRRWKNKISTPQMPFVPSQDAEAEQYKGQFLSGIYSNHVGSRSYKLYVPSSYHGQALPLVVMLHGCTQSPDEFAAATHMNKYAEAHSFLVAYPAQTFKANVGKCWNWFKETEQQRDLGEPAIIAGLARQIMKKYSVDSQRVYVAGISAGGAMAMVMGMTYPDLYAAIGVQSGVPYGVAHNMGTGLIAVKSGKSTSADRLRSATAGKTKLRVVPTIVFHGDADSLVHPDNGNQIVAQWLQVRAERGHTGPTPQVTVHQGQVPAGHAYTRSIYHEESEASIMEQWLVHGAGHAWSGGNPNQAWTDAKGPDASQEMLRFFYEHPHPEA